MVQGGSNDDKNRCRKSRRTVTSSSVADPERFDSDPDPTFQADADPNSKFDKLGRKKMSSKSNFSFSP